MSFPLPDNILTLPDVTAKQIMKKVFARQNVGVSKSMQKMGYDYQINYGVTIPQLRAIAEEFKPDHALAFELRKFSNIREAIILSSMLDEPEKLNEKELNEICEKITNVELVEQFSRNLLARTPNLMVIVDSIMGRTINCTNLCLMSFGWAVKFGTVSDPKAVDSVIKEISKKAYVENIELAKSIKFVMQVVSSISDAYSAKISDLARELSKSDNTAVAQLGNDFLWLNTI